jgi:ATP-binding cassette subfamily B protein
VERTAFARARAFLNYDPIAKWSAILAAVGSGVLYVALLVVLGLFVDLVVNRGALPSVAELAPHEQAEFLESWAGVGDEKALQEWAAGLSINERTQMLVDVGVDPTKARTLASTDAERLSEPDRAADRALATRAYRMATTGQGVQARLEQIGVEPAKAREIAQEDPSNLTMRDRELVWRSRMYVLLNQRVGPEAAEVVKEAAPDQALTDHGILGLVVRARNPLYGRLAGWAAKWNPWMWRWRLFGSHNIAYLTGLLVIAAVLALLRAVLKFVMNYMAARATVEAATRLRRAIYHHTYRLGTLAIRALGPSEAASMFTRHAESVHDALYAWLTVVFREPVKFILLLAFALAVNFWMALAFLCFAVLVWLIGGQVATHFRNQGRLAMRRAASHVALLQESLAMLRLVKCYLMELFNQSRVERQLAEYSRIVLRRYRGEAVAGPLLIFLGTLAALVLLYLGGLIVLNGRLGVTSGIVLATALASLYFPLETWLENRRILRRGRESAAALFRFLDRPGEVGQVVGAEFLPPLSKQLEFDEVTLREPGTSRMLLRDLSLAIRAGERVAIVGSDDLEKHALPRPHVRRDPRRPAQPALGHPRLAPRPDRACAAAQPGLQRHGCEQHRLRRPELHAAADHRGGQGGARTPVHPAAAAGLRDAHRRIGPLAADRRAVPHRPGAGHPPRPRPAHHRRAGDAAERRRQGGHRRHLRPYPAGPHRHLLAAPPLHHPLLRPGAVAAPGKDRGGRQPPRAALAERAVQAPSVPGVQRLSGTGVREGLTPAVEASRGQSDRPARPEGGRGRRRGPAGLPARLPHGESGCGNSTRRRTSSRGTAGAGRQ